jgi:hypothetical protein
LVVTSPTSVIVTAPQLSLAVTLFVLGAGTWLAQDTVTGAGQEILGGALSSTNMVCTQELELPQSSWALQVLVMVYSCGHPPARVTSVEVIVGVPSQLSEAVAYLYSPVKYWRYKARSHSQGQEMEGAALSSTNMVCTQDDELPQSSAALQVLVIVYSCGHPPATVTSVEVIVGVPSQLSVAVAVPVFAGNVLAVQSTVTLAGQVMVGAALSSTKMTCTQDVEFPQSSAAVQVLLMVYSCGHPPATVTSEDEIVGVPSQLSVAVAIPVLAGNVLAVQSTVTFAGHVRTGAALSSTKMTCIQLAEFPQSSAAFHVRVIVYSWGQLPATVTSDEVMVGVPSQLSVAVAVPVLAGKVLAVHRIVILAGQVITGPALSVTVII